MKQQQPLMTTLRYYGISPWEIEVLYGFLSSRFVVIQDEIEPDDQNFVSYLSIEIPLRFSAVFFKWFEFKRWERVKEIFKEIKRRRGSRNAIKIKITFEGNPHIVFVIDSDDRQLFNNAIEKIDFVLELLPLHLDPSKIPPGIREISYRFDTEFARWRLNKAHSNDKKYVFVENAWKENTK